MRVAVDAMGIALDAFAAMSDACDLASDDGELPDQTRTAETAEE
jgi:hypothetical protein